MDTTKLKQLHANNLTNRAMARELNVSHRTIAYHLEKLGLESNGTVRQTLHVINDKEALCSKCDEPRPLIEFRTLRVGQPNEYKLSYCNKCRNKQINANLNTDVKKFLRNSFNKIKLRCGKNKTVFDLTFEQFVARYEKQKGKCFYTDYEMVCKAGAGLNRHSFSVDKVFPEKGYTNNNVVFCTHQANTIKSDLTLDEVARWLPKWYDRILKFTQGQ